MPSISVGEKTLQEGLQEGLAIGVKTQKACELLVEIDTYVLPLIVHTPAMLVKLNEPQDRRFSLTLEVTLPIAGLASDCLAWLCKERVVEAQLLCCARRMTIIEIGRAHV